MGFEPWTYCVLSVNAADVIEDGRPSPLMTSCQSFLLITSTRPPRAVTRLNNSYKSNTCLAIIGRRLMGVPAKKKNRPNEIHEFVAKQTILCNTQRRRHKTNNINNIKREFFVAQRISILYFIFGKNLDFRLMKKTYPASI